MEVLLISGPTPQANEGGAGANAVVDGGPVLVGRSHVVVDGGGPVLVVRPHAAKGMREEYFVRAGAVVVVDGGPVLVVRAYATSE
ncbi:hypothetical protein TNIN_240041 [Trichonephila inaurata madagascariensis]|uniref:Uncharacterized protein n=1 Tax=Trichonephila inaurata madagascariensis TaxID=2747483 RepID=A0A8X6XD94_9ARAC|nr:hypothetical protein TNIN_240041 [Trichonephila inaurata madagascariensis]